MMFLNAVTAFMTEMFASTFAAWCMALLIFMVLLGFLLQLIGGMLR